MTDIRFYHMLQKKLEQALPEIINKGLERQHRVIVRTTNAERLAELDSALWNFEADSFLPHGNPATGRAAEQPVWLTTGDDNPNGASMLVLVDGAMPEDVNSVSLCCDLFDGQDDAAVMAARHRWKTYKEQGHTLTYFQQDEAGKWQKK